MLNKNHSLKFLVVRWTKSRPREAKWPSSDHTARTEKEPHRKKFLFFPPSHGWMYRSDSQGEEQNHKEETGRQVNWKGGAGKISFSHSTVRHYDREPASLVTRKEAGQRLGRARVNLRQSMRLFFGTRNFKMETCKLNRVSLEFGTFSHCPNMCFITIGCV